jgi:hypothetical protein
MWCTAGDRHGMYGPIWWCLVSPDKVISCMAWDGDVPYGWSWLLTLVWADGIQPYWYFHTYTGLVALLDTVQSSFLNITSSTGYEPSASYNLYSKILYLYVTIFSFKNPNPLTTISAHQPQHHQHHSLYIVTFLSSFTLNMLNESYMSGHHYVRKLTEETYPMGKQKMHWLLIAMKAYMIGTGVEPIPRCNGVALRAMQVDCCNRAN